MTNPKQRVENAEEVVHEKLAKVENVMEQLTERVENTASKIQHIVDKGVELREKAEEKVLPLVRKGQNISRQIGSRVRSNPALFWGGVAMLGAVIAYRLVRGQGRANYTEKTA